MCWFSLLSGFTCGAQVRVSELIQRKEYQKALEAIHANPGQKKATLHKAQIFTALRQRDSAEANLKAYGSPSRLDRFRDADYFHTYLTFGITFNSYERIDKVARMYLALPAGQLNNLIRRYPESRSYLKSIYYLATNYYGRLAFFDAIKHPARLEAYKNSRLYEGHNEDYEEWFANVEHFYLDGKFNRRVHQSLKLAGEDLDKAIAYDHVLTYAEGVFWVDQEFNPTKKELDAELDSMQQVIEELVPPGSPVISDLHMDRIVHFTGNDKPRVGHHFEAAAKNKFAFYRHIFPQLTYEEQRTAYSLDTLFFEAFFQHNLNASNNRDQVEKVLAYSSSWKNYLLLGDDSTALRPVTPKLKRKQAVLDIVRFSEQGEVKYSLTLLTKKAHLTVVLDGNRIETELLQKLTNVIKYKLRPSQDLVAGLLGSSLDWLRQNKVREVFVIPDGVYHLINLETLYDEGRGDYLISEFDFNTRLHIREINQSILPDEKDKILLFGNPDFNTKGGENKQRGAEFGLGEFPPLPGTEREVTEIERLMKNRETNLFINDQATESELRVQIRAHDLAHIATHGFFLNSGDRFELQRKSGLVLSRDEKNDGVLFADEIRESLKLKAKLVVLSACETGLGKVSVGEGIAGLKSAFKAVGTEALIMSYWKVSDEVTALLMQDFYRNIQNGEPFEKALIQAKRGIRKQYPEPYYWGAFSFQQ